MKRRPPEIFSNLYRDMRDRRLLVIAIVLVLAIVAVPVLLGGGSGALTTEASPGSEAAANGTDQIDPVVLSDDPGLRDFHERLDRYRSRNPFKQQLAEKAGPGSGGSGSGGSGSSIPTEGTASTGTDAAASAAPSADPSATATTDAGSSSTTAPPADPGTGAPAEEPAPAQPPTDGGSKGDKGGGNEGGGGDSGGKPQGGRKVVTYRLDVRVGPVGHTKVLHGVRPLAVLPDRDLPIVQYVEANDAGTAASFIVSPRVVAESGSGKCEAGRKSSCQFLLLKIDDDQLFRYRGDGRLYRIELLDMKRHADPAGSGKGRTEIRPSDPDPFAGG